MTEHESGAPAEATAPAPVLARRPCLRVERPLRRPSLARRRWRPGAPVRRRHLLLRRCDRQHEPDPGPGEGQRPGFYDDVQKNLTDKGKNVDELRVRVIAFRDFKADDGAAALQESPFYTLPAEQPGFAEFVRGLVPEGGGDAPESGLEAVALAINSGWTTGGDRRRRVIVVWTDSPAQPLTGAPPRPLWRQDPQGLQRPDRPVGERAGRDGGKLQAADRLRPDGPGWTDISGVWENVASPLQGR